MLDRWFHRTPKVGDRVIIQAGPFAGTNGAITAVSGTPPRYQITIDDCCRPELDPGEFIVARRTFFGGLNAAAERREHTAHSGIYRDPLATASVILSDARIAADDGERVSSIAADIAARARDRRESTPPDVAD